jgi:phage terminase large subunit
MTSLSKLIGPAFYKVFWSCEELKYNHIWLKGGRGSLKSSFVYLYVVYAMTKDANNREITNCVALRKVKETIKDSVFSNFIWAIEMLGLNGIWKYTTSPMRIWYKDSEILFRGCSNRQDFEKIKSIKFHKGYCKFAIFEELPEFSGMDEIRQILASLFRGGDKALAFYMYNPPASKTSWVNKESKVKLSNRLVHHSTYLEAPSQWLGKIFIEEAETLYKLNVKKYNHMYLGEEIGEGLEIYPNIITRTILDNEIKYMNQICRGLDFGYSHNTCYSESFYDNKKDWLYAIDEVYGSHLSNDRLVDLIKPKSLFFPIRADNEDPRTINELQLKGLNVVKTKKGKDSKNHAIKWVSDRTCIIIDKRRTPNIHEDMTTYEFKKDKEGKIIYEYPAEPDGSASLRYGQEDNIIQNRIKWGVRR